MMRRNLSSGNTAKDVLSKKEEEMSREIDNLQD